MLNQAELNFYGFNPNNIISRAQRGHIKVTLCYDANNRLFVVTRKTPRTMWQDRYKDLKKAKSRYLDFLYCTNKQLIEKIKKGWKCVFNINNNVTTINYFRSCEKINKNNRV